MRPCFDLIVSFQTASLRAAADRNEVLLPWRFAADSK